MSTRSGIGVGTHRVSMLVVAVNVALLVAACDRTPAVLTSQAEARHHASDLRASFLKASEAANRAVMADTDEASQAAATESKQASEEAARALDALEPAIRTLGYQDEMQIVAAFRTRFDEYRKLDAEILPLSVENSNLKAQKLSFGPAREASDAFASALTDAKGSSRSAEADVQIARARADVLEIQVIQARHIAEAEEAAMNQMEEKMNALIADARTCVQRLRALLPASATQLAAGDAALERFSAVNRDLVALSRRNTNVRSLALSLGRKRVVAAECEDQLRALDEALARHQFQATR